MKKQGFTLIELLAVILILGIISLIAIPTITKLLEESRQGAFNSSLSEINKIIENQCTTEQIKNKSLNKHYIIKDGEISPSIDIKGKLPDGDIYVDNDCGVTFDLYDNNFVGTKELANDNIIIDKNNGTHLKYTDGILNGADPVLDSGMIPVNIDNTGKVTKADVYSKWYDYSNKKWANTVLVKEKKRYDYIKCDKDTVINSDDILAYFVWVPRYKYAIPIVDDVKNPPLISIIFENKKTPKSMGDAKGENYHTHPGFTFGDKELNGIWVGKFKTTVKNINGITDSLTNTCAGYLSSSNCKSVMPTILPNSKVLVYQNLKNQFLTSQRVNNDFNIYGVNNDSHLMKGSEWGAVGYLSHSKYGSNNEIEYNNKLTDSANFDYITGAGVDKIYGSTSNYPQSTNNNITGIFDTAGNCWERVMFNYNKSSSGSGFASGLSDIDEKYYDIIKKVDSVTTCNDKECNGYVLNEIDGWYSDNKLFPMSFCPWITTSGTYENYNSTAGVFAYGANIGSAVSNMSFRIVVA